MTLGEGAFGVVSVCKRRATGEEFAVKMVDKAGIKSSRDRGTCTGGDTCGVDQKRGRDAASNGAAPL